MSALSKLLRRIKHKKQKNIDIIGHDIKVIMSYIADNNKKSIMSLGVPQSIQNFNLTSKVCTQKDIESDWSRYWLDKLNIDFVYHRKYWELSYVLQVLYENNMLMNGKRGIGFACGCEKLPSFFASLDIDVTASDKPDDDISNNKWAQTGQYTKSIEDLYYSDIVEKSKFEENVHLKYIDMNNIPDDLNNKFDFCWSICALEHLGSIANGLKFIVHSSKLLKPGGISVHTTEFNYLDIINTRDNCDPVIFKKEHFESLYENMKNENCELVKLDFDYGNKIFDSYIDYSPWTPGVPHLKLNINGIPITCYGIIIKKL